MLFCCISRRARIIPKLMFEGLQNKVVEHEDRVDVYLNKPKDLVYDVGDIILEYSVSTKDVRVVCDSIPMSIRNNMERFFRGDLEEYAKFLEENLEVFFKGQTPELLGDESPPDAGARGSLRPYELPRDYKFPVDTRAFLNVGLEIERRSISIVACREMNVQVECNRCKRTCAVSEAARCPGCAQQLEMRYVPSLSPEFLGFMSLRNCGFVCFNPVRYQIICDGCGMSYETDILGIGSVFRLRCYGCSSDMFLKIANLTFIQQKRDTIRTGQALPDKGACKHYKKSYRWFRFPCCRSLYPCDICHDEESGHVHQAANKMVCGLCSREQSVKKECECGMSLKRPTSFWEGGKGSRNKATMSRKDKKKYTK